MPRHTVKSYEDELSLLDKKIVRMAGIAEHNLSQAFHALQQRDLRRAEMVIIADSAIDSLEKDIENQVIEMIARRQPLADDLRRILAALRITSELERIGDLAKNIAKRAGTIALSSHPKLVISELERMLELVLMQLKTAVDAYAERDMERASQVWRDDQQIDAMYTAVFRDLLTYMIENPHTIAVSTHLLFGGKNLERAGDHATNIAGIVSYLVRGEPMRDDRPKGDDTTSIMVGNHD